MLELLNTILKLSIPQLPISSVSDRKQNINRILHLPLNNEQSMWNK